MVLQDCGGRTDLLGSLRYACNVIVPQHVQGELEAELLSQLLKSEDLGGASHVRHSGKRKTTSQTDQHALRENLPAPGAGQLRHCQNRHKPPARKLPLRGRIECLLVKAIRTAFPRVVWGNIKACS